MYKHDINRIKINALSEAYVGKTPDLLEAEKAIHNIRNNPNLTMTNCASNTKDVLAFDRAMERQFGMDIFALVIEPTTAIDAYTLPLCVKIDMINEDFSKFVTGNTRTGYRFTKNNKLAIIVHISYGFLKSKDFSDTGIMAAILHEIGHNFGDCISDRLRVYNKGLAIAYKKLIINNLIYNAVITLASFGLYAPFAIAKTVKVNNTLKKLDSKAVHKQAKSIKKRKITDRVRNFLVGKSAHRKDLKNLKRDANNRVDPYTSTYIDNWKSQFTDNDKEKIKNSEDRLSEVIADKFPAIYGYGIDAAENFAIFATISKSREYKNANRIYPGLKAFNDKYEEALFDISEYDCHPNDIQRINTLIKTLKYEYSKKEIDPKLKDELLYQINTLENTINDLADNSNKIHSIDKAHALYLSYVKDNAPDAINAEIEAEVDEMLDKKLIEHEKRYNKKFRK
jgi:hypothetical protein